MTRTNTALPVRMSEVGTLFAKLGVILLISAANSAIWVALVMLVCHLTGINVSTNFLTVFGLVIMATSIVGLSVLMLERR
jgi:hypothetical protein